MAGGFARKSEFGVEWRKPRWAESLPERRYWRKMEGLGWDGADELASRGGRARDDAQAILYCDGVIDLTSAFFDVSTRELRRTGRTDLQTAQVRQIAMYVAHVVLGLTMKQVGAGFQRDRTTVVHACHLVEDMRDDVDFDRVVAHVERVVAAAFQLRSGR